ncbi:proline-rich protein 23C-like [Kogia breviceps]|uniref:proline-rich protein 23C-like n=1 Tax=Kogia breviceps TaxID=27615 RepID=UPI002795E25F|nr:proline-rich protein 23C-like [Kogia breviceps]
MGSRPRRPSASPADRWGPDPGGQGPAKRRRTEEPAGRESKSRAAPSLDNLTWPPTADTLTFVVVLPAGCALHVPLDDVDLLLEVAPTSVRQVSLGDRVLMLVPEALMGSGVEGPWGQGLGRAAFLSAPGEYMALEPGFLCAAVPEIACQEEVNEEDADADADFLPAGTDAAAVSLAGLRPSAGCMSGFDLLGLVSEPSPRAPNTSAERRCPHHDDNLDLHLPEPFPDSPLQPLPPSPSPGPHQRPQRPHSPPRKTRKCLFPESTASHNSWPTQRGPGESLLILALCPLHTP